MIVFTGLSGSGKSSLAFDTIFAEGQRRYVESLSSYARQFLGQMDKPDVDFIEGLSPAVSIDQKSTSRNPRSTVGTITEVYDYLRLLFARAGQPHCPVCGELISRQTPQQIVDRILAMPDGTKFQVLAPVVRGRKGEYLDLFGELQSKGYARALIVPDPERTLREGAIQPWASGHALEYFLRLLEALGKTEGFNLDTPWRALSSRAQKAILYGAEDQVHVRYRNKYGRERSYYAGFEGVVQGNGRRHADPESEWSRDK